MHNNPNPTPNKTLVVQCRCSLISPSQQDQQHPDIFIKKLNLHSSQSTNVSLIKEKGNPETRVKHSLKQTRNNQQNRNRIANYVQEEYTGIDKITQKTEALTVDQSQMFKKGMSRFESNSSSVIFGQRFFNEKKSMIVGRYAPCRSIEEIEKMNKINKAASQSGFQKIIKQSNLASVIQSSPYTTLREVISSSEEEGNQNREFEQSSSLTYFLSHQHLGTQEIIPPSDKQTSSIVVLKKKNQTGKNKRMDSLCFKDTESINSSQSRSISEIESENQLEDSFVDFPLMDNIRKHRMTAIPNFSRFK